MKKNFGSDFDKMSDAIINAAMMEAETRKRAAISLSGMNAQLLTIALPYLAGEAKERCQRSIRGLMGDRDWYRRW